MDLKTQKNILAIIPARAGSKRIVNKNKKQLAGKELVCYSIEAARASTEITYIAVSSDDDDILDIASHYDGIRIVRRPNEISGENAPAITYVQHALETIEKDFDIVVIIQPTSPFTTGLDIDGTIRLLYSELADSAVSVVKLDHAIHPAKLKVMKGNVLEPYYEAENGRMAAHELPEIFVRNGSVYASTLETIAKGKIIGDRCLGFEMPRERSLDINDPIDFEFAEFLMIKNQVK